MSSSTPVEALERAVSLAGGQSAFAMAITKRRARSGGDTSGPVSQARIWNWLNRDKKVPAEFCPDIEALWGIACEELAPAVDWAVVRRRTPENSTVGAEGGDTAAGA
jgi:DNA-binding transcriptional regulator YdaS (Cro superfamily)